MIFRVFPYFMRFSGFGIFVFIKSYNEIKRDD
nr:MAG TPA: hypothetical protein [Caudoviricetes sp.]